MSERGLKTRWRTTRIVNIVVPRSLVPHEHEAITTQILNLDGKVLTIPNMPPADPHKVECPNHPRLRHDPSLIDMTAPPIVDDVPLDTVERRNPCASCNVGFLHGGINYAVASMSLHFFALFYCLYIALFTEDYTRSFLKFWGVELNVEDGETSKQLFTDVHVTCVVGSVIQLIGMIIDVGLIYGLIEESIIWCHLWCLVSSILSAISMFGVAYMAACLTFLILLPIPFSVMIQLYGLWVIITYVKSLFDPIRCRVCHRLLARKHCPPESETSISLPLSPKSMAGFRHVTTEGGLLQPQVAQIAETPSSLETPKKI